MIIMIEIITLCGVSVSMVVSGVNLFLNWYRAKDLPLKKHSKSVFIDRSISCFVKLVEYLKTHNITHEHSELISIKNDKISLTCFIPVRTITIDDVDIIPVKVNTKLSSAGYVLTSDTQENLDTLCGKIFL